MKIANVALSNMRTNGPNVMTWLKKTRPGLVTLQKIGLAKDFPTKALFRIGYESRFLGRQSVSDLGVGILSKSNLPDPKYASANCPAQSRWSRGS